MIETHAAAFNTEESWMCKLWILDWYHVSGCTTSFITNPLDLVRARVQVHRRSIPDTIRTLWRTEQWKVFSKGLTARMTSSSIYSLAVIFGYESVKKMSVLPQYSDLVSWWSDNQWFTVLEQCQQLLSEKYIHPEKYTSKYTHLLSPYISDKANKVYLLFLYFTVTIIMQFSCSRESTEDYVLSWWKMLKLIYMI